MSLATRPCKSVSNWCCKQTPMPTPTVTVTLTPTSKIILYADVCTNAQADINGDLVVNVYMDSIIGSFGSSQVTIDTSVDVFVTVFGDATNDISGFITVPSGASFGSGVFNNFLSFENIISINIDLILPTSSSTQIYLPGYTTFAGSCSSPASPTPTKSQTPTPTPTQTITGTLEPTPTNTPTHTITPTTLCCYQYEVTNYYTSSKIVYYTDCDGTPSNISCVGNGLQTYINCALEGSLFTNDTVCDNSSVDCITWNAANTPCGGCVTVSPTPTNTLTNTKTPTLTPTLTPTPSIIVSYLFCMGYDSTDCATACADYSNCNV